MKPDCVIVNHENNNIVRTPAGFLVPNKSIVTTNSNPLNSYSKQIQVNDNGNIVSNGSAVVCKTLNGFNGNINKPIKSGQLVNHILVSTSENNQGKNNFNGRVSNFNGNPMVLVATSMDTNRSQFTVSETIEGSELHNQVNSGSASKRWEGDVTSNYIKNINAINGAFNEKNPGAGGLYDASLVTQVNLLAAFHDHVSYTKITSEITKAGGMLTGFNGAVWTKKLQSLPEAEESSQSESKEQVFKLKTMILTHLDLIQHQQEMLLKKDRQLQGLKQDRESLLSRLEKMEKKMSFMSKKITSLTELSKNSEKTETNFKSKESKSTGSSSVSSSSSSPVFSDYFSSESASNALFIKLTNDQSFKQEDDSQSSDMMVIKSDGPLSSPLKKFPARKRNRSGLKLDGTSEVKNSSKSTSTSPTKKKVLSIRKKQSSTSSSASSITSSLESEKNDVNEESMTVETTKPEEIPFSFMISHDLYEVVNMWDVEDLEQEERKKVMSSFKLRSFPDCISNKAEDGTTCSKRAEIESAKAVIEPVANSCDVTQSWSDEVIEVPSWRILPVTGSYVMEGTENLDDEVFNKRHSKMEIDERRRKRWDIQRLREQKHNEKLKQGRYYSKAAFVSTDTKYQPATDSLKNEPEPVSFFPDPMDAQVIEVCDELPLLAFGHPIPIIPEKPFSIPWNTRTKCDRKSSSSSGPTCSKSRKGIDPPPSSKTEDYITMATETTLKMPSSIASKLSHQPIPKGTKPFFSAKKMSIGVS